MKDFSDVQYELAVRIASRNIPVFTRVHSAVFASGAVTCILLVFLFFQLRSILSARLISTGCSLPELPETTKSG